MHLGQLLCEHEHLLRSKRIKPYDRSEHVACSRPGELAFSEPGFKRFIAVYAAPSVFQRLRRRSHYYPEILCLALKGVVIHGQHLLIVVLTRYRIRYLIYIHKLVNKYHHAPISGEPEERGKELQVIVPVIIRYYDVDAERLLGFALKSEFTSEPAHNVRLGLVVAFDVCVIVLGYELSELESMHQLADRRCDFKDLFVDCGGKGRVAWREPCLLHGLCLSLAYPPVKHKRKRAAFRLCLCRKVAYQLAVRCEPLTVRSLKLSLRRKIGIAHDEAFVHNVISDRLYEEALTGPVAAHDEPERRAAFLYDIDIVKQRLDLTLPAHRDIRQADPRNDSALERVQNRLGYSSWYFCFRFSHYFLR